MLYLVTGRVAVLLSAVLDISDADVVYHILGVIIPLPLLPAKSSYEQQADWLQSSQVAAYLHLVDPIAILYAIAASGSGVKVSSRIL